MAFETHGATHFVPGYVKGGTGNISLSVDITYSAATNKAVWSLGARTREIAITAMADAAQTVDLGEEFVLVVFDSYDDASAAAALGVATGVVEYHIIPIGTTRIFRFTDSLERADFISTLNDTRVIVEAL